MANFETKTIKQIYDGIIAKYTTLRNKYGDTAPLLEKAAVRSIAYAFAGVAGTYGNFQHGFINNVSRKLADLRR